MESSNGEIFCLKDQGQGWRSPPPKKKYKLDGGFYLFTREGGDDSTNCFLKKEIIQQLLIASLLGSNGHYDNAPTHQQVFTVSQPPTCLPTKHL